MNNSPRIINDWKPETLSLLNRLTAAGCLLVDGNNGEDRFKFDGNLDTFIENLLACDEATVRVKVAGRDHPLTIWLVLGNEPGVIASDYVCHEILDKVTEAHYEEWSGKPQPKKTANY